MKQLLVLLLLPLFFAACSSAGDATTAFLDRLEFECGETGEVTLTSQLDLDNNPLIGSNTTVAYRKVKEDPNAGCPAAPVAEGGPPAL